MAAVVILLTIGTLGGLAVLAVAAAAVWHAVNWPSDRPPLQLWQHCVQPQN